MENFHLPILWHHPHHPHRQWFNQIMTIFFYRLIKTSIRPGPATQNKFSCRFFERRKKFVYASSYLFCVLPMPCLEVHFPKPICGDYKHIRFMGDVMFASTCGLKSRRSFLFIAPGRTDSSTTMSCNCHYWHLYVLSASARFVCISLGGSRRQLWFR